MLRAFSRVVGLGWLAVAAASQPASPATAHEVRSPDDGVVFRIARSPAGQITWATSVRGLPVIEPSALGIVLNDVDLGRGAMLDRVERYRVDETYPWRGAKSQAVNRANGMRVRVTHDAGVRYTVDVRVANDSVAFKHLVPGTGRRVPDGGSMFTFPSGSVVWSHGLRDHYEAVYERRRRPGRSRGRLGRTANHGETRWRWWLRRYQRGRSPELRRHGFAVRRPSRLSRTARAQPPAGLSVHAAFRRGECEAPVGRRAASKGRSRRRGAS